MTAPVAEDYAAAGKLIEGNAAGLIRNADVNPTWLGDTGRFWYERRTAEGVAITVVDAKTGESGPAFDHEAVAAALSTALELEEPLTAATLGLQQVRLAEDLDTLTAVVSGKVATVDLAEHRVELSDPPLPRTGLLMSPSGTKGVKVVDDNLVLVDLASGREIHLTEDGAPYFSYGKLPDSALITIPRKKTGMVLSPFGAAFSPDGRFLICPRVDERDLAVDPYLESVPTDGSLRPVVHEIRRPYVGERTRSATQYFIFDIVTGARTSVLLPLDAFSPSLASPVAGWSTERAQAFLLLMTAAASSGLLLRLDLRTGQTEVVIAEPATTSRFEANTNMYNRPNIQVVGDGAEVIWYSDRSGYGHLYRYDAQTGELLGQLTDGEWMVLDIHHVDEEGRDVYFTGNGREEGVDPYYRHLYRVSLDGGEVVHLTGGQHDGRDALHADHSFAPTPVEMFALLFGIAAPGQKIRPAVGTLIDTFSTVDSPPVTVLRSVSDGTVIAEIERADVTDLLAAGYVPPTRRLVKAADGETDVATVYYAPARAIDGGKHPVIDAVYGGPQVIVAPRDYVGAATASNPTLKSALARLGFAVVVVDGRGTPQRGNAFRDVGFPNFTAVGIADHVAAIEQLAELHPELDLERVGIHGWSWGGTFSAQAILTRGDFYDACVSGAGVYDYAALYPGFESSVGLPIYADGTNTASATTEKPASWGDLDITAMADRLQGKLMIVWGDADENVPPLQAFRLIDALTRANKPYDALVVPNGSHSSSSQAINPYTARRTMDYFVEHLLGVAPPEAEPFTITPRRTM